MRLLPIKLLRQKAQNYRKIIIVKLVTQKWVKKIKANNLK